MLPSLHGLLFSISSKGSFICAICQTRPQPLLYHHEVLAETRNSSMSSSRRIGPMTIHTMELYLALDCLQILKKAINTNNQKLNSFKRPILTRFANNKLLIWITKNLKSGESERNDEENTQPVHLVVWLCPVLKEKNLSFFLFS